MSHTNQAQIVHKIAQITKIIAGDEYVITIYEDKKTTFYAKTVEMKVVGITQTTSFYDIRFNPNLYT